MMERTFVTLQAESKTPEYLALNPRGEVPVLTDGDVVVHESIAIVAYLEGEFPEPALFGATSAETGRHCNLNLRWF
jgi:glutathione S-transferase